MKTFFTVTEIMCDERPNRAVMTHKYIYGPHKLIQDMPQFFLETGSTMTIHQFQELTDFISDENELELELSASGTPTLFIITRVTVAE